MFVHAEEVVRFQLNNDSDPRINPQFLPELRRIFPQNRASGARISLDPVMGGSFDNQIMENIKTWFAVMASDAQLYDDGMTREVVDSFCRRVTTHKDFVKTIVNMIQIGVKRSGESGEIMAKCSSFN